MRLETQRSRVPLLTASACTLAAWLIFSFTPVLRVWGLGFLSPLGGVERAAFLVLAAASCLWVTMILARRWEKASESPAIGTASLLWIPLVTAVVITLLCDRTHFVGDGVRWLAALPDARVRSGSEFRLMLPLLAAARSVWSGDAAALRAYQTVTIGLGIASAWVCVHYARRIFDSRIHAWVFACGQLSAGYMLVFFGYVENHALLVFAVLAFTVSGMACLRRRAGITGALVSFLVCVLSHPLGWSLLPACLYLVATRTPLASRWQRLPLWLRATAWLAVIAALVTVLAWLYETRLVLRLAIVPLFRDRLTVDGYTFFSIAHLADLVNLVLLMLPGLAVGMAFLKTVRPQKQGRDAAETFLLWSLAVAGLAAVCLDPPLGLPRSWDRAAFAAVPLAAWLYYRLLRRESPRAITAAALCVSLSLCTLVARAWVQVRPEPAVRQAMTYFRLDPGRSRTGVLAVGDYLLDRNTTVVYSELQDFRSKHYPEEALRERLNYLYRDNRQLEAADVCQQLIKNDPRYAPAWMFLGFTYNNAGRFDSAAAYLTVADALDPHNTSVQNELGRAYYFSNRTEEAVALWQESLAEDSLQYVPHLALATWNRARGNVAEATRHLAQAASRPDAPGETFLELARDHAAGGRQSEARAAYEEAVARNADSTQAAQLLKEYPQLGPPVVRPAETK